LRTASSKRFQRWREVDLTAQGRERLAILPSACLAISAEQRLFPCPRDEPLMPRSLSRPRSAAA
jgi:hypothetical protein